jgi:hypothetical protein
MPTALNYDPWYDYSQDEDDDGDWFPFADLPCDEDNGRDNGNEGEYDV